MMLCVGRPSHAAQSPSAALWQRPADHQTSSAVSAGGCLALIGPPAQCMLPGCFTFRQRVLLRHIAAAGGSSSTTASISGAAGLHPAARPPPSPPSRAGLVMAAAAAPAAGSVAVSYLDQQNAVNLDVDLMAEPGFSIDQLMVRCPPPPAAQLNL